MRRMKKLILGTLIGQGLHHAEEQEGAYVILEVRKQAGQSAALLEQRLIFGDLQELIL